MRKLEIEQPMITPMLVGELIKSLIATKHYCRYCHNEFPKEMLYSGYCVDCIELELKDMYFYPVER